jgi:hypothetical protein
MAQQQYIHPMNDTYLNRMSATQHGDDGDKCDQTQHDDEECISTHCDDEDEEGGPTQYHNDLNDRGPNITTRSDTCRDPRAELKLCS